MARHGRSIFRSSFLSALSLLAILILGSSKVVHAQSSQAGVSAAKVSTPDPATFLVAPAISVSGSPSAVAVGDLNGDGQLDLVVANTSAGKIAVFMGKGTGKFAAPFDYSVGKQPVSVVLADVNGDGKLDVVVCNEADGSLSVLLGVGDGTFKKPVTYKTVSDPVFVAVGDLNGDGKLDLTVAGRSSQSVAVHVNDGTGGFTSFTPYQLGKSPNALVAADFDGDNHPDIATANSDGTISVLLSRGDGTIRTISSVSAGRSALSSIASGDFNHDGKADLAITQSGARQATVFLGKGDGTFQSGSSITVGSNPVFAMVADVNGDGLPDLITANQSGNTFSVLLGNGDGTFQSSLDFAVGNSPRTIAAGDFNGDGRIDLAIANFADNSISIPLGNGDGTFKAARAYNADLERKAIAVGDLDGDGKLDLVVTNFCGTDASCSSGGTVSVFLAAGGGTYRSAGSYPLGAGPLSVALADVNGDKGLDLIAVNRGDKSMSVLLGNGDGTFQSALTYPLSGSPLSLAVGDFNRDGKVDLAITTDCGAKQCGQPGELNVLLGNGDSSFQPARVYTVGFFPVSIAIGDVDGDGNSDIVVANTCGQDGSCQSNGTATLMVGDGKGTFKSKGDIALGKHPSSVALGDLGRRKVLDLVVTRRGDNKVAVLRGKGDGSFMNPVAYPVGTAPTSVVVADFNGDGNPDVAVANLKDSTVSVLSGNGDSTLQPAVTYPGGVGPESLAALDAQANGHADLVAANGNGGSSPMGSDITVLSNVMVPAGTAVSSTTISLTAPSNPSTYGQVLIFTGFVTGDGHSGTPTGNVNFTDGGSAFDPSCTNVLLTAVNTNKATATCGTTKLTPGPHAALAAMYPGDTTYAVSSATLPATQIVNPLPVTVVVTVGNKAYDGKNIATINLCTVTNVVSGDTVTCTVPNGGTFSQSAVGTNLTVTVPAANIVLAGASASNYTIPTTNPTTTANINPLPVTVTVTAQNKTYDGKNTATINLCTVTNVVPGDTVTCTVPSGGTFAQIGAGNNITVTVPAASIVLAGASASNYTIPTTNPTTTANINPLPVTVTVTAQNKTYDGKNTATINLCTVTNVVPGDTVTCTVPSGGTFSQSAVGNNLTVTVPAANIVLAGVSASSYTIPTTNPTTTANINPLPVTVTVTAQNKTYDGKNTATINLCTVTNVVPGDTVTCTVPSGGTFSQSAPGNNLTVTVPAANIVLAGASASKYTIPMTNPTTTANINPLAVTVTVTAQNKTYDGTTAAKITNCTVNNVLPGDTVTCTVPSGGTFSQSALGNNLTVTVPAANIVLAGASAANYTTPTTNPTTTANINPLAVTVVMTAQNKTYDGKNTATINLCTVTNVVPGDTVTCTAPSGGTFAQIGAGNNITVTVPAANIVLAGASAANYTIPTTNPTTTANINPLAVTVSVTAQNKTYDGTTTAKITNCTVNNVLPVDAGNVNCTIGSANFAAPNAGTGIAVTATGVTLTGSAAGNYSPPPSATTTANISSATAAFSSLTQSQSIIYGTASVAVSGVIAAPGPVDPPTSEAVTVTINNTQVTTPIQANGKFSTTLATGNLGVSSSPYTITYDYNKSGADKNFVAATDNSTRVTVTKDVGKVQLQSLPSPSNVNDSVTFTATVSASVANSTNVPTGTVTFTNGGVKIPDCSQNPANINPIGVATCTTTTLIAPSGAIVASYSGDNNFSGGSPHSLTQTVNTTSTTMFVGSSPSTSVANTTVAITATVTPAVAGRYAPTGKVTFTSNGVIIPNSAVCVNPASISSGSLTAACNTTSLVSSAQGMTTPFTASFQPSDHNFTQSAATAQQVVQDFALSGSGSGSVAAQGYTNTSNPPSTLNQQMSVTAVPLNNYPDPVALQCAVTPQVSNPAKFCSLQSAAIPSGGGTVAVTISPDSNTLIGTYVALITANDATYGTPVQTTSLSVNVVETSSSVSVIAGAAGTTSTAFTGPSGVTVSNLQCKAVTPLGSTGAGVDPSTLGIVCSFSPPSVVLSGMNTPSANVTVTVTTSAGNTAMLRGTRGIFEAIWLGIPAILLIGPLPVRKLSRQSVLRALGLALILIVFMQSLACGGGFTKPPTATGTITPTGSYNLLVQGTGSDSLTYSSIVPLNVGH